MNAKILVLFVLLLAATSAAANEATKCYEIAWGAPKEGGLGLNTGQAIDLCSGTSKAEETIKCYVKAWGHPGEGGLGLNVGQAVRLCKRNALSKDD